MPSLLETSENSVADPISKINWETRIRILHHKNSEQVFFIDEKTKN